MEHNSQVVEAGLPLYANRTIWSQQPTAVHAAQGQVVEAGLPHLLVRLGVGGAEHLRWGERMGWVSGGHGYISWGCVAVRQRRISSCAF